LHVNPVLHVPVDEPTVLLFAAQQGCPMPPHGWQTAVDDWDGQYVFGAVHT
jgi:hypothetical protein